jgi:hypothetical protein
MDKDASAFINHDISPFQSTHRLPSIGSQNAAFFISKDAVVLPFLALQEKAMHGGISIGRQDGQWGITEIICRE